MQFRLERVLDAPLPALFDVISDPALRPHWQSSLRSVRLSTDAAPDPQHTAGGSALHQNGTSIREAPALGPGTRWRETTKVFVSFEMEITRFEPNTCWAERGHNRFADAWLSVYFQPSEHVDQTRVAVDVRVDFHGMAKLCAPLVRLLMPGELSSDLRRAAELARRAPRDRAARAG